MRRNRFEKKNEEEYTGGNFSVSLRNDESSEMLIKRFMRKLKKERLINEIMDNKHYKKPSVRRREAHFERLRYLEKMKRIERMELELEE